MSSVESILALPTTPETVYKVAELIAATQKTFSQDHAGVCAAPAFDRLMAEYSHAPYLPFVLKSIYGEFEHTKFYPAQITKLANLLVEKFGQKMVDPSQFVAMGGFPAADDDDVIIIEEPVQKNTKKVEDAEKGLVTAIKKLTDVLADGEKSRARCDEVGKRRREMADALYAVTAEHNQLLREDANNTLLVQSARSKVKAAELELKNAKEEEEDRKAHKKARRE